MMTAILITRPSHDVTTGYLHTWSKEVADFARARGMKVLDLPRERATRKEFLDVFGCFHPKLVFFNGHGSEREICGHGNEVLVESGRDEALFGSCIIYSRSCDAAKGLGKSIVAANPSSAFIGYENKFVFPFDPASTANPLRDEMARPFLESSNLVVTSLAKGNTVRDAHRKSQDAFQKKIDFYETQTSPEAAHVAFFLKWDMSFQRAHGNLDASLGRP